MDTTVFSNGMREVLFSNPSYTTVENEIAPYCPGQVRFQGSYWRARFLNFGCNLSISKGSLVKVVGREGNMLLVEPFNFR